MKNLLTQIQKDIKLTQNEENIITYIIEHSDEIPNLSSRELARRCYTTATSIMRLVKKLGYKDYNDFRYNAINYFKNLPSEDFQISSNENALSLLNKIAQIEVETIQKTKEMISLPQLQDVVELLNNTIYIDIIASDTNKEIARYFSHYLYSVGKIASVYYDSDKQVHLSLNIPKDHVVIVISKYARNEELLQTVKLMKNKVIKTILLTGNRESELSKWCDITLSTPMDGDLEVIDDSELQLKNMVFHTSIKYIFDVLYTLLFSIDYENSYQKLTKGYYKKQ